MAPSLRMLFAWIMPLMPRLYLCMLAHRLIRISVIIRYQCVRFWRTPMPCTNWVWPPRQCCMVTDQEWNDTPCDIRVRQFRTGPFLRWYRGGGCTRSFLSANAIACVTYLFSDMSSKCSILLTTTICDFLLSVISSFAVACARSIDYRLQMLFLCTAKLTFW